ncbi:MULTISPECIES: TonB-dependent receptor [Sphingobium]|uniref:TonB-dependent receptor n=1 Tax=Sphingobium baderi TaxID=1332080 RepID=A0A0S3EZD2_9SPHN|nr:MULTISPECIES: TonB-dependent receptor [Sphingobium]ALR20752.1 TonB-dependent receptor [Sphingobium baderi]
MKRQILATLGLLSGTAVMPATPLWAQDAPSQAAEEPQQLGSGYGTASDIVVTARRRDERLQDVPVSVSAFSAAALERSTVQTVQDINTITPGFRAGAEGGKENSAVSLRGIGQVPLGEVSPGVVTYFANVPLPSVGSNIPTYDLASIQVLKGPQGTLFGRNTLGGAVLVSPEAPTYDFGGYIEGTYGRFDYRELEGALNIPIIPDKMALRVAGQMRRQDGRTKNLNGGPDFDNVHQDSVRASLLIEPTDWIKSLTIVDYFRANERAGGLYLYRAQPGVLGAIFGPTEGAYLDAQIANYREIQKKNFYGAFDDGINGGQAYRRQLGITNDTSLTFGNITVRNIFGFRKNRADQMINTGATGPLFFSSGAPFFGSQFSIFHAGSVIQRQYITNELQVLGEFDGFNFIVGGFYNNDRSTGPMGSNFRAFAVGDVDGVPVTAHVANKNYAVFGQVGIDLTDKLRFNVGARYSWDKVNACGGGIWSTYVDRETCDAQAALGLIDGVAIVSNKGQEPSWTIGFDYKPNDNTLLYIVSRRGYRGANVNTPGFESPFTTGGVGCSNPGGACPDLRPYQNTKEEKLTDGEIGAKLSFRSGEARGFFNIAAFYTDYKGALQFLNAQNVGLPFTTPDQPTNGSVAANIANLEIYGVEIEASVSPVRSLTVSFNGAFTKQKVKSLGSVTFGPGVPTPVATEAQVNLPTPSFAGTASVSWTLPFRPADGEIVFNGDIYMTDDFGGQNGEKLPGYALANARLDWRGIGGSGFDLGVYVRNLTGAHYYQSPSVLLANFPTSSVYVGDPRTWGVSARYRF